MSMVNFPSDTENGWDYTNEGGLYAYAVWGEFDTEAQVSEVAELLGTDVLIHAEGPEAANRYRMKDEWDKNLVLTARTVLFLGSTSMAWFNDDGYFPVTRKNLTGTGRMVLETLEKEYGCEATIITLLDT